MQHQFRHKSGGEWRKDEARPLVSMSAFCTFRAQTLMAECQKEHPDCKNPNSANLQRLFYNGWRRRTQAETGWSKFTGKTARK